MLRWYGHWTHNILAYGSIVYNDACLHYLRSRLLLADSLTFFYSYELYVLLMVFCTIDNNEEACGSFNFVILIVEVWVYGPKDRCTAGHLKGVIGIFSNRFCALQGSRLVHAHAFVACQKASKISTYPDLAARVLLMNA